MNDITIIKPDDFHIHLRQGKDLIFYAKDSARQFKRGIVMPNTIPPIVSVQDVKKYRADIKSAAPNFEPLMTFKISPVTDPSYLIELQEAGVLAGKYYPAGATTNSEDGITDWTIMRPVLKEMEKIGMVLSVHGEIPDSFMLDRENDFLPILLQIHKEFPTLKIILEHVSTKDAIDLINTLPNNIVGTITLHHMISTIEDVVNNSNNKCMPVPKLPKDRDAILNAAISGNPKFFFGSDSAPHKIEGKMSLNPKAGVYTAPVILPKLVEIFHEHNKIENLEPFVSKRGADFYGLKYNTELITLENKDMLVPELINGVKPYLSGKKIKWRIKV